MSSITELTIYLRSYFPSCALSTKSSDISKNRDILGGRGPACERNQWANCTGPRPTRGHEPKKNGEPVCERLRAVCDFLDEDEDMEDVEVWVFEDTNVDRVYFYGKDRPIHASYSQTPQDSLSLCFRIDQADAYLACFEGRIVNHFFKRCSSNPKAV